MEFYEGLGICLDTSSIEHQQTIGQVKTANKVILNELKKSFRHNQCKMDQGAT